MDAHIDTVRSQTNRAPGGEWDGLSYHRAGPFRAGPFALLLTAVLPILLVGCHGGVDTDLLEREMRIQEDRIYELEDHLMDCHNVSTAYRRENQALRQKLGLKQGDSISKADRSPSHQPRHSNSPTKPPANGPPELTKDVPPVVIEGEENGEPGSGDLGPPNDESKVPTGPPLDDASEAPPFTPSPDDASSRVYDTLPEELPPPEELPTPDAVGEAGAIERIEIQRLVGAAQPPAPEGLLIRAVVEPRSANGQPVHVPGEVSLMILDPAKPETDGSIARWNFALGDAATRWRQSGLGSGWHFDLPLPATLEDQTYELWARFVTADGTKFLASTEFDYHASAFAHREALRPPGPVPTPSPTLVQLPARVGNPAVRRSLAAAVGLNDVADEAPRWSPSPRAAEIEKQRTASAPSDHATPPRPAWSPYR